MEWRAASSVVEDGGAKSRITEQSRRGRIKALGSWMWLSTVQQGSSGEGGKDRLVVVDVPIWGAPRRRAAVTKLGQGDKGGQPIGGGAEAQVGDVGDAPRMDGVAGGR